MKKAWAMELNNKLRPITEAQKEYHRLRSSKYIFVHDKSGNATCSRCGSEINIGHTSHKEELVCPSCASKLIVQHNWRMSKKLEVINWMVIPKAIDSHTLCLRYVLAHQLGTEPMRITEKARLFINEHRAEAEYYCLCGNEWRKGKHPYFATPSFMTPNRFWCLEAYEYPRNFFKLVYQVRSARLNEKLYKVGFDNIADYHRNYFIYHNDRCYPQNYKATSLMGMMKLDKPRYDVLKKNPCTGMMLFLQNEKDLNVKNFAEAEYSIVRYKDATTLSKRLSTTFTKANKYLENVNYSEHMHYLEMLTKIGYDIKDLYYSMPKDFKAADKKITKEYMEMYEREKLEREEKNNSLIKEISDGLRAMPKLQEFLNGSDGFLVYVPESANDLKEEGENRHNCVGTYVDRIAEGKTLVFFVRRLNDPTAPFIDMEICNGKIVQIREDHNKPVTDSNVIDFCERFATALKAA